MTSFKQKTQEKMTEIHNSAHIPPNLQIMGLKWISLQKLDNWDARKIIKHMIIQHSLQNDSHKAA